MILVRLAVYISTMYTNIVSEDEIKNILAGAQKWHDETITSPTMEGFNDNFRTKYVKFSSKWYIQLLVLTLSPFIINSLQGKLTQPENEQVIQ